jgi:hypothetical protein
MNRNAAINTIDFLEQPVIVGSVVRVLGIDPTVFTNLEAAEVLRVQSMIGQKLVVYEVDQWGHAWVEMGWQEGNVRSTSHSVALDPKDMELVE